MSEEAPPQARPLVLYVDDERPNRVVFEAALGAEFRINAAPDAGVALEILAHQDVAVLVTDIRMPDVDGLQLLRIAKEKHPNTLRMVVTAFADIDPILRAINEGLVARYIVKPWDRDELVQVLRWATELWTFGKDSAALLRRLLETERLASLGGLAALYVHDLKTPIMVVNNLLDELRAVADAVPTLHAAIQASDIDERIKARLLQKVDDTPEIVQDAKQASVLIKDMIAGLSDYIRNKKPNDAPVIDPTPVIQFTVNMFQRINIEQATSAKVGYRGSKQLPHVRISPVDLTQVLVNLVNNATQAVQARGEPDLHVALEARTQGDMLELQIRDEGVGMSAEVLKKVGTPWFSTRSDGTGLGIANCQRLIGRAGGRMRIESEPGVGTTVTILLPTTT